MRVARLLFICALCLPLTIGAAEVDTKKDYKGSSDICVDEVATQASDGKITGTQKKNESCVKAACNTTKWKAGQCQCGIVRIVDEKGKDLQEPVSKCDPEAAKKLSGSKAAIGNYALSWAAQSYLQDIKPGTEQGDARITQALKNLGVSDTQAQQIVKEDSTKAYDLLQKIAGGQTEEAKQVAAELRLNPDIAQNISRLEPKDLPKVLDGVVSDDQSKQLQLLTSSYTGFGQNDPVARTPISVVPEVSEVCQRLPGGCGTGCDVNPNRLVCQTRNPGAIVCSAVATKFGAVGCHPNNRTAIFPTVEQGAAAMASLLTSSSRYFASGEKSIVQALCSGYSEANCIPYARFVSQYTGIPINQTIDPRDSVTVAKIMTAMSRFENGNGAIFTPQQLQTGLEYAFGGKELPAGTPGYVPSFTAGGVPSRGYYSPFALGGSLGTPSGVFFTPTTVGTATGGVPPLSSSGPVSTGAPVSTGGQVPTGSVIPTTGSTGVATTLTPVATLVVQPQKIVAGGTVSVSWSSVGMNIAVPCTLTSATSSSASLIKQANEGSEKVILRSAGTYTFALRCTSPTGTLVEKSAKVTVQ